MNIDWKRIQFAENVPDNIGNISVEAQLINGKATEVILLDMAGNPLLLIKGNYDDEMKLFVPYTDENEVVSTIY